ncbi:copper resistance protein NlpE [Sphingobacterium sp. JB170]|uniref:copper resistance protein NlpE n=1 Tax=Sphingobacterium sp. JB170 TaxID=1434842 RepID=UPI000B35EC31|nr:copper resistance protein NlpE [Sphingobacterium sp. JB170]
MKFLLPLFALSVCLFSCGQPTTSDSVESPALDTMEPVVDTEHTSQNSLDWAGTYETTLPCADCPGIKSIITLNSDETFAISNEYLERNTINKDNGKFMWHDNGSIVHLRADETNVQLKVGENKLIQLDADGNVIDGELADMYIYEKQ